MLFICWQDDNSLQIDETGSAYSLPGPSTQLDSSPGTPQTIYKVLATFFSVVWFLFFF